MCVACMYVCRLDCVDSTGDSDEQLDVPQPGPPLVVPLPATANRNAAQSAAATIALATAAVTAGFTPGAAARFAANEAKAAAAAAAAASAAASTPRRKRKPVEIDEYPELEWSPTLAVTQPGRAPRVLEKSSDMYEKWDHEAEMEFQLMRHNGAYGDPNERDGTPPMARLQPWRRRGSAVRRAAATTWQLSARKQWPLAVPRRACRVVPQHHQERGASRRPVARRLARRSERPIRQHRAPLPPVQRSLGSSSVQMTSLPSRHVSCSNACTRMRMHRHVKAGR